MWRLCVLAAASITAGLPLAARPVVAPERLLARRYAAPEIIIAYGPLLPERRVIPSWHENLALVQAVSDALPLGAEPLARRPAVRLALFWGAGWRATAESPARLRALRPEQASQHGTFYPATATAPPVLAVGAVLGVVSDSGLAVLRRHGVPVRIPTVSRDP